MGHRAITREPGAAAVGGNQPATRTRLGAEYRGEREALADLMFIAMHRLRGTVAYPETTQYRWSESSPAAVCGKSSARSVRA
jgi:hypothetical protein